MFYIFDGTYWWILICKRAPSVDMQGVYVLYLQGCLNRILSGFMFYILHIRYLLGGLQPYVNCMGYVSNENMNCDYKARYWVYVLCFNSTFL